MAFIKIYTFSYYILDQSLIIEFGLFKKEKINIPFKKITGIHIEQKFLHQPFDLAMMKIETAGSNKTEGEIPSIQMSKALELKELILSHATVETSEVVEEKKPALMQMSAMDILRFSISSNHLKTSIWLLSIAWVYFIRIKDAMGENFLTTIRDNYIFNSPSITIYAGITILVLLVAAIYSIVRNFLKYDGFVLFKEQLSYQLKMGMIDKKNNIIPFRKVQFIRMTTNWWRNKWNIYTISIKQSQGGKKEKENKSSNIEFPVFDNTMCKTILNSYYNDFTNQSVENKIHSSYWVRLTLIPAGIILFISLVISYERENYMWMLAGLAIIIYNIIANIIFVKKFKYFINEDALQIESGLWGKKVELVQWKNVQNVIVTQTIFQKRKNLSNLKLITASGIITLPYINDQDALKLKEQVVFVTADVNNTWT